MVVWSQIGMVGYLLGPLAGGLVAESLGYAFIGTVSAAAGLLVVALLRTARSPVSEAAAEGNLRRVT
jgi:MFS family permease